LNVRRTAIVIATLFLTACGGGGTQRASLPNALPTSTSAALAQVNGTLLIPSGSATASTSRRPQFLVSQTAGVTVAVRAHGSTVVIVSSSFDLSTNAAGCTVVSSGRSCLLSLSLAPSSPGTSYDLAFTTFDTAPAGGAIPATANALASGVLGAFAVTAGVLNTFSLTLSGTAASVAFPATALATTGTPSIVPAVPAVRDAAGNTIIGAYTSGVTIALTDTGAHAQIGLSSGSSGSSVTLHSSGDAALVQLNYDGNSAAGYVATLTPSGVPNAAPSTIPALSAQAMLSPGAATAGASVSGVLPVAILSANGQSVTYTLTETGFTGTFTATVQTVSGSCPTAPVASAAGTPATFTLTFAAAASCTIVFSAGNTSLPPINVSNSPAAIGTITEYGTSIVPAIEPAGITRGSDGNLWYADPTNDKIGRVTTGGTITQFAIPAGSQALEITSGSDGALWFTEQPGNIGRMTTAGVYTNTFGGGLLAGPQGIAAGPDGNLWFAEIGSNSIGRITPAGVITEFTTPTSSSLPLGITAGPDGRMWFTEAAGNKIGAITTTGVISEFAIPTAFVFPHGITPGPDGKIWFTEQQTGQIGNVNTTSGLVTELSALVATGAYGIVSGPDGDLWYADFNGGKVGRSSTAGAFTEFGTGPPSTPYGIVAGPDGNLWYTDPNRSAIGKIVP
jgi:streptogramin lyase